MNLFQELKELARKESLNEISQGAMIQKAIDIATSMGGNMTGDVKKIEKIKRGLSKNKNVANALRLANEDVVSEKFKPYLPKGSERVIDMYIQFRGNGEEKDFAKAKKMVMDYSKKHKLDIKDHPRNKVFGTPQEGSSAYKLSIYAKFTKDPNHDLAPLYKQLSTLKTAEDHGGGYAEPIKEETVSENYRTAARHGMGTEGKKEARVGLELDYYDKTGAKHMGKIVKKDSKGYTVKDDKTGKMHTFVYHDRVKARKFLQQGDNIQEKVEYAEYKFKNKRDAQKALDYFKSQQLIKLDINDDGLSQGELAIDAGKKDMTKQHKEVLKKFKPKVLTTEMASAQQAAIAIAKKKKNESVMDAYRDMWEENLNEEMITYRVKKMQRPEEEKFKKSAKMMGLKITMDKGRDDTVIVMSGTKKKLRDFDSVARGKSSFGDPSTISHFDEK